jgi:hypothetical protein
VVVQIFLRFAGKKPGVRRKLPRNIGNIKDKDSTPYPLTEKEGI